MSESPRGEEPRQDLPERLRCLGTAALGVLVIGALTRYNMSGTSVWSSTASPAYRSWDEYLLVNITGIFFLPCLLVLGLYRQPLSSYGVAAPAPGAARIAWVFYAAMAPVLVLISRQPVFYHQYPMLAAAGYAWPTLAAFELTYGFYFFCWEFFYRGFLTFGLGRALGYPAAIAIQSVGFGIMHYGKPVPEFYSSFAGGAILGWLAVRGGSFLPCFALHWAISATLDLLAIHARHTGLL